MTTPRRSPTPSPRSTTTPGGSRRRTTTCATSSPTWTAATSPPPPGRDNRSSYLAVNQRRTEALGNEPVGDAVQALHRPQHQQAAGRQQVGEAVAGAPPG